MYSITFCRYRNYDKHGRIKIDIKGRSQFVKKFNTLSEIAKFYHEANSNDITLLFRNLSNEMSNSEYRILRNKLISLHNKDNIH